MSEAIIVVGLGFGDEGKGGIVDYLARHTNAGLVVRFNGGAQAGHRAVTSDGKDHVFSQFGAGTFAGARTFLSKHVLVNPLNLMVEADALYDQGCQALGGFEVDPEAVIITPYHVAANRLKERCRGDLRHGSCGQGIGEARAGALAGTSLLADDLADPDLVHSALTVIQFRLQQEIRDYFHRAPDFPEYEDLNRPPREFEVDLNYLSVHVRPWAEVAARHKRDTIIFEGAQGALLDESRGYFMPHVSWTNCTAENAWEMLGEIQWTGTTRRVGVTRTYATRHGAGPFPSEDAEMTRLLPDPAAGNGDDPWQGSFRVGLFDPNLFEHALSFCPVNEVALTCLDRHPEPDYDWPVPVTIRSYGETADQKLTAVEHATFAGSE